jgi:predicted nucleic-acid-binding Zn-ribbon protein
MAIFACTRCGYSFEQLVSNNYSRRILRRMEKCVKCNKHTYFNFVTHSGRVASPMETDGSMAAQYWRKARNGRTASAPLDRVCKVDEW